MAGGGAALSTPAAKMAFSVSIALVLLVSLVALLLRVVVRRQVRDPQLKALLSEAITVSELTCCCFELATVYEVQGLGVYSVCLFLMGVYQTIVWQGLYVCPYSAIEDWYLQRTSLYSIVLLIGAQVVGGWLAWRYIRAVWWLEISPTHKGRWVDENCTADLQVAAWQGGLVEGGAVFTLRFIAMLLNDIPIRFSPIIKALASTALVLAGFNYSGGYYNPALASAMKMGCDGHTIGEHLFVYWAAATIGAIAAINFYARIRPLIVGPAPRKRD